MYEFEKGEWYSMGDYGWCGFATYAPTGMTDAKVLIGQEVTINGQVYKVRAVEHQGRYTVSKDGGIGLMVHGERKDR